jgi:hypothetical protein
MSQGPVSTRISLDMWLFEAALIENCYWYLDIGSGSQLELLMHTPFGKTKYKAFQ